MRFIVVTAPTLQALADELNAMIIGSGRFPCYTINADGQYETIIDMFPTHVVTNDDLLVEIVLDEEKIALTA